MARRRTLAVALALALCATIGCGMPEPNDPSPEVRGDALASLRRAMVTTQIAGRYRRRHPSRRWKSFSYWRSLPIILN